MGRVRMSKASTKDRGIEISNHVSFGSHDEMPATQQVETITTHPFYQIERDIIIYRERKQQQQKRRKGVAGETITSRHSARPRVLDRVSSQHC